MFFVFIRIFSFLGTSLKTSLSGGVLSGEEKKKLRFFSPFVKRD